MMAEQIMVETEKVVDFYIYKPTVSSIHLVLHKQSFFLKQTK